MVNRNMITDAELDIMKVLWKNGASTSPAIFTAMENSENKNTGTLKTLLTRLVQKGAVRYEEINLRNYLYIPVITEEEYIRENRRKLIDRMFDGSAQKFLLNLIKDEKITRDDLDKLTRKIEED